MTRIQNELLIASMITSFSYIAILLFYTHGALLFGSDNSGFYSLYNFLQNPNPVTFMFTIGLILAAGNYYAGFYIGLFLSALLTVLGMYLLVFESFNGILDKSSLFKVGTLASVLYLFNPTAIVDTFKSFTANVYVTNAAFFLFLAELIRIWRSAKGGTQYRARDFFLLGIGLGVSASVFPNNIRTFVVGGLISIYLLILSLGSMHIRKPIIKHFFTALKMTCFALIGVFTGGLYSFLPMLQSVGAQVEMAKQGAISQGSTAFISGTFNTLLQVWRLLGVWAFPAGYAPYYSLYVSNTLVILMSFLWPVLAIGLPFLLSKGRERSITFPLLALMIIMIFWEKAANPPAGHLYSLIASHIPFGSELIPTYFLSALVLSKLYPFMAAFSIVAIYRYATRTNFLLHLKQYKVVKIAAFALIVGLLVAALPAFTGQVEGQYFNQNQKGYWIPSEYSAVRNFLDSNTGGTLLLPALSTYVQTSWGYQGSDYFYNSYFAPSKVYSSSSFGGGYASTSGVSDYYNLTSISLVPSTNRVNMNLDFNDSNVVVSGAHANLTKSQITVYQSTGNIIQISFEFPKPVDISNATFVDAVFGLVNWTSIKNLINQGAVWIGLASDNIVGWYVLGSTTDNSYVANLNGSLNLYLKVGSPDKPFPASTYDASRVTGMIIKINSLTTKISLPLPSLYTVNGYSVNPAWLSSLQKYGIHYLLLDTSIVSGVVASNQNVSSILATLGANGIVRLIYNGTFIELWEVNYPD